MNIVLHNHIKIIYLIQFIFISRSRIAKWSYLHPKIFLFPHLVCTNPNYNTIVIHSYVPYIIVYPRI